MLKFFRSLRHKLIQQHKIKNYLIYATGEVLLVMVGILLALQVNNWNQNRLNRIEETHVLKELKKDFIVNQEKITGNLIILNRIFDHINNTKESIKKGTINLPLWDELYNMRVPTFEPINGTIIDVLSSNKLRLVTSNELRRLISAWQGLIEDATDEDLKVLNFKEMELRPFMIECCPDLASKNSDVSKLFSDYKFDNLMTIFASLIEIHIENYEAIEDYINEILDLLDKEIGEGG